MRCINAQVKVGIFSICFPKFYYDFLKYVQYEKKLVNPHHDHMICIETGDIIEFHNEAIETLQDKIAENHGYEVIRHVHQLFVKPIKKK